MILTIMLDGRLQLQLVMKTENNQIQKNTLDQSIQAHLQLSMTMLIIVLLMAH